MAYQRRIPEVRDRILPEILPDRLISAGILSGNAFYDDEHGQLIGIDELSTVVYTPDETLKILLRVMGSVPFSELPRYLHSSIPVVSKFAELRMEKGWR